MKDQAFLEVTVDRVLRPTFRFSFVLKRNGLVLHYLLALEPFVRPALLGWFLQRQVEWRLRRGIFVCVAATEILGL